ncbi:TPA: DUF4747 family protein [Pseudomonas aeruginosa]|nr:DUF4747 family protein [Pseudomonas aeruginosa]
MAKAPIKKHTSKQVKGRERKYRVSAINIVLHPHSPEKYAELWREIFSSDDPVKVRGTSAVMIGSCSAVNDGNDKEGVTGVVYKFFKLDAAEPWFDTQKRTAADKGELSKISIPDHLKPHLQEFSYVFYPKGHRLYFVSSRSGAQLSPKFLLSYLERVVERAEFSRFGEIKLTVVPSEESISQILSLSRLKSLYLDIHKPNPDDQKSAEALMQARLKKQNIKRSEITLTEASSSGIKPDDETKILIKIAANNGEVRARGQNSNGELVTLSTEKHPLQEVVSYDSNIQSERSSLQNFAASLHARFFGGR